LGRPDREDSVPEASDAVAIAANAAEDIRVLNQATHPATRWPGLTEPVDVYEVLGCLSSLVDRLQQTASQLTRFLEHRLQRERLAVAFGTYLEDPTAAVAAASEALEQARITAGQLAQQFSDAQATVVALCPADNQLETEAEAAAPVIAAAADPPGDHDA
jgi:hypothetical protein